MKSGHRSTSYRIWRFGLKGLKRLQTVVDKLILESEDDRELVQLGLPDLKLRINREVRENYLTELKSRREEIELQDLELAQKNDVDLLIRIRDRIDNRLAVLPPADDKPPQPLDIPPESPESSETHPDAGPQETTPQEGEAPSDQTVTSERTAPPDEPAPPIDPTQLPFDG